MHASSMKGKLLAVTLFLSSTTNANPFAVPRAIVESALDPWVSVDASGTPVATITPILSTINGVETTISAAPDSITATATSAMPTSAGGGSYLVCHNKDGDFAPFCKPDNGSEIYVGENYYVTWDTTYLDDQNSTVVIQGDYVNSTGGGEQAFHSDFTQNTVGSVTLTVDERWLLGKSSNNITLYFFPIVASLNLDGGIRVTGPTLTVTNRKAEVYHQEPAKAPKGQSLYIALPTVFGFIILCLIGGFFWNRKVRKIGLGNVMGRNRGYGAGKSRTQRMGLGKRKGAAIHLQDQELANGGQLKVDTTSGTKAHVRADSEALGSLAGTPTEEKPNHFREELKRQDQNRF